MAQNRLHKSLYGHPDVGFAGDGPDIGQNDEQELPDHGGQAGQGIQPLPEANDFGGVHDNQLGGMAEDGGSPPVAERVAGFLRWIILLVCAAIYFLSGRFSDAFRNLWAGANGSE
ncbi:hypothetical protein FRC12_006527 [Ceratobasidium sp. 428]|nr:hypothetical protein FRC09_016286 [Ceratobasidium sp. 395]KAG8766973.1 hypothetical protein FRC12_006527 [Ceratobasidium sp. 428]